MVLVAAAVAGCSDDSGDDSADDSAGEAEPTTTTTTVPLRYSGAVLGDHEVAPIYRQGLARTADGWLFSTNNAFFRTDPFFVEHTKVEGVIPEALAAEGFDHVGDVDIDIAGGILWAPLERPDRESGQVIARYDAATLEFVGSDAVPQHHASFVAAADDVVYSMDEFDTDDTIVRYRWTGSALEPLDPLPLSRALSRVQGGDVADGALWLSTDDEQNGVYRVDLATGEVTDLGSAGRVAGEGEGIDAANLPDSGLLRVLVADEQLVPMWVVDVEVSSEPE